MAKHTISLRFSKEIGVLNRDIIIEAKENGLKLGILTISRGSIDWRPKSARSMGEINLKWTEFARLMESASK